MFKNISFGFFTLLDRWSPLHLLLSAILAFFFGFLPAFLFGVYYDISQSYMRKTQEHWSWIENAVFSSDQKTDGFDILIWNLAGCFLGSWIRFAYFYYSFYGFLT